MTSMFGQQHHSRLNNSNSVTAIFQNPVLCLTIMQCKAGVPVSETVTLVGGLADAGTVCNEGVSLER